MKTPHFIPDSEFKSRIERTQRLAREAGLDALLVHSNEADYANVRYLSDYWPLFESAGVWVPSQGEPRLLIGPESETFSRSRTKIPEVRKLIEYREPAEPDYPGIQVSTFESLAKETLGHAPKRIGVVGWAVMSLPVYLGLKKAFPEAEVVKSDDVIFQQRAIKSDNEIQCLKDSFRITELATGEVIRRMKPGMTELELAGIAQGVIYANGAEYEGLPMYVLAGLASSHAIGRPGYRKIEERDLVQLNLSAKVHGYSGSLGVPVVVGDPSPAVTRLLEFGLKAHRFTIGLLKAGMPAKDVAIRYADFVKKEGYAEYMLYGPCHGLGMIEVERPWIEATSSYELKPNMTFQIDTFFYTPAGSELARQNGRPFGLRWENGCRIVEGGVELLGTELREIARAGV
ncbi:MAG: Xaa-Pro peptidase family protein [Verrucomicrobiae bacterium]|nr:Xaa-Pro peptidase family protein [Verrucomicrobiae bacterium]